MQNIQAVLNTFSSLEINPQLAFSNIPKGNNQYLTHGYHRYPAKFIPSLASYLIKQNTKKEDLICDPFGGCGTTLVEAKINGRQSIGIDINPLAGLISKAKITAINPKKLEGETKKLLVRIKTNLPYKQVANPRLLYWFDMNTLTKLQNIYGGILETKDKQIQRFYICAFSHILKNCSRWLMKSIKPTIDKDKKTIDVKTAFLRHLLFMSKKNNEFYLKLSKINSNICNAKFYLRDARNTELPENSVDYILTSPPYVTSYEYADLHELSLLWLEDIDDWVGFKKKFIGTSHRDNKDKDLHSEIGNSIVAKLLNKDKSLHRSVRTYYEDMYDFLSESKRILKKRKKISLVIGNTTLKDVDILNAEVAFEQMLALGFRNLKVEKRQTSSQSITPYRDLKSGRFTSVNNPLKRRAYQYEYILTGQKN